MQSPAWKSVSCWKVLVSFWQETSHATRLLPVTTDQMSITPSPSLCHFKLRGFSSEQRYHTLQNHGIRTGHVIDARYELTKMAVGGFDCQDLFHSMTARNEPHDEAICFPRGWQGTFRRSSMTCSVYFPWETCQIQVFRVLRKHA